MYNRLFCYKIRTYRITTPSANNGRTCSIANNTTETNTTETCNIDCSGNWNVWSVCNNQGKRTRTFNNLNNSINCPTDQIENCPFDCSGNWNDWRPCYNINQCNNTTGIGNKTRTFTINEYPLKGGKSCPTTESLNCTVPNYPACTCSYDILNNTNCNYDNTECKYVTNEYTYPVSICTPKKVTEELPGGICPPPDILQIIEDQRCNCNIEKTFGNWNYTDERCIFDTYNATRSREITVKKIGGLKRCLFPKKYNEYSISGRTINNKFQFNSDNDKIGTTFNIIEIENINWPNNYRCI